MSNAKKELLDDTKGLSIKCAFITYDKDYGENKRNIILSINYSDSEYQQFLKELDFEYDSGYGGQELYGTVWLNDGTWLSRGEYDGSEWWQRNILPTIPTECIREELQQQKPQEEKKTKSIDSGWSHVTGKVVIGVEPQPVQEDKSENI